MKSSLAIVSALGFSAAAGAVLFVAPGPVALFLAVAFAASATLMLASRDRAIRLDAEEAALRRVMGERS